MTKLRTTWLVLMASIALSLPLTGCDSFAKNTDNPLPKATESEHVTKAGRKRPISKKKIKAFEEFGFQLYWDAHIKDETIIHVIMEGDQLYAFTHSNRLYQVDVHSGMVNWVYDVGRKLSFAKAGRRPISEWLYKADANNYKQLDELFFVADDYLYAIDKKDGSELWVVPLGFTPSSPPQSGDYFVYLGSWDDRIYAIKKTDPTGPGWYWRTDADVTCRPAYIRPTTFLSSTDGTMYAFDSGRPRIKWRWPTQKKLLKDPIIHQSLLYLPADDFNLYVLGVTDGLLHYRFTAGAPITSTPVAIGKSIFFTAKGEGMHALLRKGLPLPSKGNPRKTMHELAWQRQGPDLVLCRGSNDVYMREPGKTSNRHRLISRLDIKEGNLRDQLEVKGVDFWVTNPFDPNDVVFRDRALRGGIVFLGYRNGWIVAFKETTTIPGA